MNNARRLLWSRVLLAMVALAGFPASAQEFRALVSGRIVDSTGAAITNANVSIVSLATQARSATLTANDGNFALSQLVPGTYDLTAEALGFRRYVRKGITLAAGDKTAEDVVRRLFEHVEVP